MDEETVYVTITLKRYERLIEYESEAIEALEYD